MRSPWIKSDSLTPMISVLIKKVEKKKQEQLKPSYACSKWTGEKICLVHIFLHWNILLPSGAADTYIKSINIQMIMKIPNAQIYSDIIISNYNHYYCQY